MAAAPTGRLYEPGVLMCITAAALGILAYGVYGPRFFGPNWSALLWLGGLLAGTGSALGITGSMLFAARPGACRLSARTPLRAFIAAAGAIALWCWIVAVVLMVISATA